MTTKVFIGGSRLIGRLNPVIRQRLDNMVDAGLDVLVGDANGSDRAVQEHLADRGYASVTVYCMLGACRNNVGGWRVHEVDGHGKRGYEFYSLKDAEMSADADCAFMIWDAKSKGTFANMVRTVDEGKPTVVYLSPTRECRDLRVRADLERLLDMCSAEDATNLSAHLKRKPEQATLFTIE